MLYIKYFYISLYALNRPFASKLSIFIHHLVYFASFFANYLLWLRTNYVSLTLLITNLIILLSILSL